MKSRRVPYFRIFFIAAFLCALGAAYGRVGLFPGRLLDRALAKIEAVTNKKVLCDKILYIPFRGFTLDGLQVFEKNGSPIFSARALTVNVRLLPFFREKKVILDHFIIDAPVYDYWLDAEKAPMPALPKTVLSGQIEVPVVPEGASVNLKDLANGPDSFLPENVYLEQIEIKNGVLLVRKSSLPVPVEEIRSINIRMGFQKPPLLRFDGQVKLGRDPYATVDLKGFWDLKKDHYEFYFSTLSRQVPQWMRDYQKGRFLILEQGQFSLKTHLVSGKRGEALFESEAHLNQALMQAAAAQYTGRMHLDAAGVFDTTWKRFEKYKGRLELVRVNASHISSKIERLDNLTGSISFEPDLLTVQSVRGEYKKVGFEASGTIRSFRDRILNGRILSHLSMEQLLALLPAEMSEKIAGFKISGDCEAVTLLSGTLKTPPKIETEYAVQLRNASVKNDAKKINWSDLSGELRMNAKGIEIRQARFTLSGSACLLEAFIPKIETAPGRFHVRSKNFEVSSDYTVHGNDLWLQQATAASPGISASFTGKLLHWTDPWLETQGQTTLDLEKLSSEWAAKAPFLKSLSAQGVLRGPFVLNGRWDQPLDWEFKMDSESPLVRLQKTVSLEKFELQIRMKNRYLNLPYLRAELDGGTLGSRALFDLTKPGTFFDSRIYLNSVDLSKLGAQLVPPKKELAGTLVGQLALRGTLQKPESYRGQGALSVTNGLLWRTDQFKAMGNLPLVKVEGLDLVTFHEMNATFEVRDKKIHTDNLSLLGDTVNLSLRGTLSFDRELDMLMSIQYSDDVYRGAAFTGGFVPLVVEQAGGLISQYHVHGSLEKPQYDKTLLPVGNSIGKKIGGIIDTITS